MVRPHTQSAVFGQAVSADARPEENHVAVGGPDLDGVDHLGDVHTVFLGKPAPLVHKRQRGRPVGVFHDFAGFAFDGAVQDGQRILVHVYNAGQEADHFFPRFFIVSGTDPPEVADGGNILAARHNPLKGVSQQRF